MKKLTTMLKVINKVTDEVLLTRDRTLAHQLINRYIMIDIDSKEYQINDLLDTLGSDSIVIKGLSVFNGLLSMYDNPEISIDGNVLVIKSGNETQEFLLGKKEDFLAIHSKAMEFIETTNIEPTYVLTEELLEKLKIVIKETSADVIKFSNGKIEVFKSNEFNKDVKNNKYQYLDNNIKDCNISISSENINKLIKSSYDISFSDKYIKLLPKDYSFSYIITKRKGGK